MSFFYYFVLTSGAMIVRDAMKVKEDPQHELRVVTINGEKWRKSRAVVRKMYVSGLFECIADS